MPPFDALPPDRREVRDIAVAAAKARNVRVEMQLGLPIPPELQALRLALQVKKLRDRFKSESTGAAGTPAERFVGWCATPGVADARERERVERVRAKLEGGK